MRPTCRTSRALTSSGSRSIGRASLSAAFLVSTSRRKAEQPAQPSRCATRLAAAATSSSSSHSASMSGSEVSQSIVAAPGGALQHRLTSASDSVFRRLARLAAPRLRNEPAPAGRPGRAEVAPAPPVRQESLLQEPASTVETGHHRAEGDLEDVGRLAIREILEVDELDDDPEILREASDRPGDVSVERPVEQLGLGRRRRRRDVLQSGLERRPPLSRSTSRGPALRCL